MKDTDEGPPKIHYSRKTVSVQERNTKGYDFNFEHFLNIKILHRPGIKKNRIKSSDHIRTQATLYRSLSILARSTPLAKRYCYDRESET